MSNPLYITEILAKVFKYLDTQDLAVVSFVNKTWRLEARRIIYQNRSDIIYSFFKRYLNNLRLDRHNLTGGLLSFIPFRSFVSLKVFRYAFGLDIKTEFLSIRRQFRNEHRRLKKICKKLDKEAIEKNKIMEPCILYSKEYYQKRAIANRAFKEFLVTQDHRFDIYRDFVNFEYFLVRLVIEIFLQLRKLILSLISYILLTSWKYGGNGNVQLTLFWNIGAMKIQIWYK